MQRNDNLGRAPRRWAWLIVALALCAVGPVYSQAGSNAHSIVGTWTCEATRPDGSSFRVLQVFDFGGATSNWAAPADGQIAPGSWKKDGHRYLHTFYFLITDASDIDITLGYVKGVQAYTLETKDRIVGYGNIYILLGEDPLNPVDSILEEEGHTVVCDRLPTEAP